MEAIIAMNKTYTICEDSITNPSRLLMFLDDVMESYVHCIMEQFGFPEDNTANAGEGWHEDPLVFCSDYYDDQLWGATSKKDAKLAYTFLTQEIKDLKKERPELFELKQMSL